MSEGVDASTHDFHFFKATRSDLDHLTGYIRQIHANGWEPLQVIFNGYQSTLVLARRPRGGTEHEMIHVAEKDARGQAFQFGLNYVLCKACKGLAPNIDRWPRYCEHCGAHRMLCDQGHCGTCGGPVLKT